MTLALLDCPPNMQLVAAIGTMVLGNHFLAHFPAESIRHRGACRESPVILRRWVQSRLGHC